MRSLYFDLYFEHLVGTAYKVFLFGAFWSVFYRIQVEYGNLQSKYGDLQSKSLVQSACGKIWTRKTPSAGPFHTVWSGWKVSNSIFKY